MDKSSKEPRGKKRVLAVIVDDDYDETEIESEAELEPENEHRPIHEPEPEHEPQRELVSGLVPAREHELESNMIAPNSNPPQPVQHEQIDKSDESDQPKVKSKPPCARIQPMEQRKFQVRREEAPVRHAHAVPCTGGNQCIMPECLAFRGLINHWNNCANLGCSICGPFLSRFNPQPQVSHQQPVPGNSQIQGPILFNPQTNFSRDNLAQPSISQSQVSAFGPTIKQEQQESSIIPLLSVQPDPGSQTNVPSQDISQPSTSQGHVAQSQVFGSQTNPPSIDQVIIHLETLWERIKNNIKIKRDLLEEMSTQFDLYCQEIDLRAKCRSPSPVRGRASSEYSLPKPLEICLNILSEIANNPNAYQHQLPNPPHARIATFIYKHQQQIRKIKKQNKQHQPPQPSDGQTHNSQPQVPVIPLDMGSLKNPETVRQLIDLLTPWANSPNDPEIKRQVYRTFDERDDLVNAYCRLRMIEEKLSRRLQLLQQRQQQQQQQQQQQRNS